MADKLKIACLLIWLCSCQNRSSLNDNHDKTKIYSTVSYLDIKLDSRGNLPSNPYILEFAAGNKHIIFCGTNHLEDHSDVNNPMYTKIGRKFWSAKPDVCINEGGDVSNKKYASKKDAVTKDAEIGLVKILADSAKIKTINGDPTSQYEFKELLKKYTKGEILAYIATERLMWQLKGESVKDMLEIERKYKDFVDGYIIKEGKVELTDEERSFAFFKTNYQKLLDRRFSLNDLEPTNPFDPKGKFQQIGRYSKEIRDQFLLKKIDNLLDKYDKVFVVFGGWHLLRCKPGLEEIVKNRR